MTDLTLLFPTIFLAVWALVLLMYGAFGGSARTTAAFACFGLAMLLVPMLTKPAMGSAFVLGQGALLGFSPFTQLAQVLLLVLAIPVALLAEPFFEGRKAHRAEIYTLMLLSLCGMFILTAAQDFLPMYMGLELMSFPLYIMAAMLRDRAESSEAALKYFVLGGLASGLLLFGVGLVYAATGTTQFASLMVALGQGGMPWPLLSVGLALTVLAVLFKLSVVPFHMWTPDVYQGAPTPVTAFMAALPKLAAIVLLVRLLEGPLSGLQELWQPALAVLAAASMVVGSVVAIRQTDVKRLLAWSTIANVGFVLCGVVAASPQGHGGVLFYLAVYGLTMVGLFAVLIELENLQEPVTVHGLAGLARRRPWLATMLLMLLFSMAGVPPFAGFMAKLNVFAPLVAAGYTWLAVVGVMASVVAAFYSLWLVKTMYFDVPSAEVAVVAKPVQSAQQSPLMLVALAAVAVVLVLGVLPGLLSNLTLPAATALF
ncbi:MAG: NADH-quinone oxidoreductase subunit N [Pseudomonadaceae bacterium]|nr:NADH-quinone oxidoreductase subunit N [Pseudomonadaceae bacterium]